MSHSIHEYVSCILDEIALEGLDGITLQDEIALEGLDGITLQGLWVRLSQRPNICLRLDSYFKNYVWNLIKRLKDLEMYELPQSRGELKIFNRFDFVDSELGTVIDPVQEQEDIYPYNPIDDNESGNRGSCSTYKERKNVTETARSLSLEEIDSRWGSKLVIVANQRTRNNALLADNIDPLMELTLVQFCLLERIGRSRYHGEVTIGKISLQQLGIDPKSLFYLRKYLINHKLITKQIFHLKSGAQNSSGSLLHLIRFFVLRRPKVLILTQKVVEILKARPGNFAEYEEIRQVLGLYYSLKKLMKTAEFQRFIKTDLKLPYRMVYPEAKPSEWKLKAFDKEKMVRVIQLIKPDIDIEEIWSKDDDEEEDFYEGHLDQSKLLLDRPLLYQACDLFDEAGPKGLSQVELGAILGQTRLESRNICRNLVKCGLVSMYMQDVGRQRVTRFMSKKYSNQGEMSVQYEKEKQKMLELLSVKADVDVSSKKTENGENQADVNLEKVIPSEEVTLQKKENMSGENIETEVTEHVFEPSKNNMYTGFQEDLLSTRWNQKKHSPSMTYRLLKRANLIMECVRIHKVIYDCKKLMQHINDEEEKEGYNVKIDKKSLFRLLGKLKKDGHIKDIGITLRMENNVRDLKFICEPSVTKDDAVIQSAVEQAKVKFFVHQKVPSNSNSDGTKLERSSPSRLSEKFAKDKTKDESDIKRGEKISVIHQKSLGKKYGFSPKFVRMKILHRFLFYLIYGYEGKEGLDQSKLVEQIILDGNDMAAEITKELPTIYYATVCWKTFVPPLPKHSGFPDGWTFMSDWLLRIPLSMFVKIYNITYAIPSLEDYLNHPIRQHYLVKSLPSKVRKFLFMGRRYIFSIHEVVCRLCYIGLIQFGPQRLKEKDQVFIFLNRRASLLDTTPSLPGYHKVSADTHYEKQIYNFAEMSDVDKYWYDMWNICIKTQLGGRMCVTGNNITLEALANKEAMVEATQARNPDEAPSLDVGFVPGDRRGAAGLDSAIFSHLKRNWNWNTLAVKRGFVSKKENQGPEEIPLRAAKMARIKQGKEKINIVQQMTNASSTKGVKPGNLNKGFGKVSGMQRKKTLSTSVQTLCKKKVEKAKHVVRKVLPRKTKRARPYYDEEDRKALAEMKKLRVDWSEFEDALLLTCKVAGLYFFPNPRYLAISFQAIRDVLHQTFKESKNKTSRACQRRILYVMRNPATAHSVALSLLDLKHDASIKEKFDGVIQKAKAAAKSKEHLEKLLRPAFVELVQILSKRMDTIPKSSINHASLRGSIDDLRSKYVIAYPHTLETKARFHDVKNVDDIWKAVLHSVIHSSFCCSADKTSWAYQLFKVYQQYPDSFLKASMNKFRTDQMVTLKKQYSRSFYKSGNFLPISSCPYQLSMSYAYLFQTEYQFEIFHQAYRMMKKLESEFHRENRRENDRIDVTGTDGGGAATLIELFSRNKATLHAVIPEQIIILDPVIAQKRDTYDGILKRFREILENTYRDKIGMEVPSDKPLVGSGKRKRETSPLPSSAPLLESDNGKKRKLNAESIPVVESRDASCNDEINKKNEVAGSEIARSEIADQPADETLLENKLLSNNAACAASRIALYLMRKELTDSPLIDPHHAHDFFVVNSCEVFCKGINTDSVIKSNKEQAQVAEKVLQNIKSSLIFSSDYASLDCLYKKYKELGADDADWKLSCEIMNYVGHAKEMGVTVAELREKFGKKRGSFSLACHLKTMAKEKVFLRAGISTVRYVHHEYSKPWVVLSNKLLRLQRENIVPTELKAMNLSRNVKPPGYASKNIILDVKREKSKKDVSENNSCCELSSESSAAGFTSPNNNSNDKGSLSSPLEGMLLSTEGTTSKRRSRGMHQRKGELAEEDNFGVGGMDWNSVDKIKVLIRPWVRVDGSLNRRVLDRFLGSVLGHILQNPGSCIRDLGNRFTPALQPCHTRELVEILSDLGCVKLGALQMKKPTLFSRPSKVTLVIPDGTEDESMIFISPQLDAVSKLGIFLSDKKYAVDFLGKIL